jgi:hypothetical protein
MRDRRRRRILLADALQHGAADRGIIEQRLELIESHSVHEAGRILYLDRDVTDLAQQRQHVAKRVFPPVDLVAEFGLQLDNYFHANLDANAPAFRPFGRSADGCFGSEDVLRTGQGRDSRPTAPTPIVRFRGLLIVWLSENSQVYHRYGPLHI